jgi:hypothetical protein
VAPSYVRATFSLLTRSQIIPDPGPPPPLDYDTIVLARSPAGYWPMRDLSPTNPIIDISGNGLNLDVLGSGLVYQQGDLLTDPGGCLGNNGGLNFGLNVALGNTDTGPDPFTVAGWIYINSSLMSPGDSVSLFDIGGSSGGAQITKAFFYRNSSGGVNVYWNEQNSPNPALDHTATFATTTLPLDTILYFSAGQKASTTEWFFKINDQPAEFLSYAGDVPWQIPGRQTYFRWASNAFTGSISQLKGKFARVEYYTSAITNLDMWTDWHL